MASTSTRHVSQRKYRPNIPPLSHRYSSPPPSAICHAVLHGIDLLGFASPNQDAGAWPSGRAYRLQSAAPQER
jgi:hypothetical protein